MLKISDGYVMPLTSDHIDNDIISSINEWSFNNIVLYFIFVYSIDN